MKTEFTDREIILELIKALDGIPNGPVLHGRFTDRKGTVRAARVHLETKVWWERDSNGGWIDPIGNHASPESAKALDRIYEANLRSGHDEDRPQASRNPPETK